MSVAAPITARNVSAHDVHPLVRAFRVLREAATVFGSAVRVSAALQAHQKADPADLRLLGIDPKAFKQA